MAQMAAPDGGRVLMHVPLFTVVLYTAPCLLFDIPVLHELQQRPLAFSAEDQW